MTMLNGGTEVRGVGCQVGSAYSSPRLRACAFASASSSFLNALWMLRAASSLLVQHSLFIHFSATLSQAPLFVTYNCLFPPSSFVPHSLLFIFPPLVPASHNPMVYHHFSLFSFPPPLVVPPRLSAICVSSKGQALDHHGLPLPPPFLHRELGRPLAHSKGCRLKTLLRRVKRYNGEVDARP